MENKEVIIDDVDVSECEHLTEQGYNSDNEFVKYGCESLACHNEYGELMYYSSCEGKNCNYKKLKRTEQQLEAYKMSENEAKEIIAELEQKNKTKDKEIEQLKSKLLTANIGSISYSAYKAEKERWRNKNRNLKQSKIEAEIKIKELKQKLERYQVFQDIEVFFEKHSKETEKSDKQKLFECEQRFKVATEALNYYSKSYLGVKQSDGKYIFSYPLSNGQRNEIVYDPTIAQQALKQIEK